MNLSDATIDLSNVDCSHLLSDWSWLVQGQFSPMLMTAFGDLFLQSADGHVWLLDLVAGEFKEVASSRDDWASMFNDPETVDEWLMPDLVEVLFERGMNLTEGTCYGYRIPPVLGGKIDADNIEQTDLSVHFAITGQIHRLSIGTQLGQHNALATVSTVISAVLDCAGFRLHAKPGRDFHTGTN